MFEAVLWDFGGVITESPFDAFDRYERQHALPEGFVRRVNSVDPDVNAWARFERSEIDATGFDVAFADESAALGHRVPGADIIALLAGDVRPAVVQLLDDVIAAGYRTACLTNNVALDDEEFGGPEHAAVMDRFDLVVSSSTLGRRKPEPEFYLHACTELGVDPSACVFLDDLGINLKPAALGMTTIKVTDPAAAETELRQLLDVPRR